MAEDMGDRTELPSSRRLTEARGKGQVAKSQDLSAAVDLIGAMIVIVLGGGLAIGVLATVMRRVLSGQTPGGLVSTDALRELGVWTTLQGAKVLVPLMLGLALVAFLSQVAQVGWHITMEPLAPKFNRLNPFAGLKRLGGTRNLVKTGANVAKLAVLGTIATLLIRRLLPSIAALPLLEVGPAMYRMAQMALEVAVWLLAVLLALGIADFCYQRWQHTRDLRMTKQEVKEERRSSEGDPEIKARRFRMAREIAMHRIQQDVPRADVIVTNPTHFSVAIRYEAGEMHAPKVVAKGADFLAMRIRAVAIASGVPIVERPPLARGLYWGVDVGREIDPEFYEAVAEVLAYVYRVKGRVA